MSRNFFEHLSALLIVSGVCMLWSTRAYADNTLAIKDYFSPLAFSGYVETYYGVDFNKTLGGRRPPFLYNFTEDREVAVNLALLKGSYITHNIRANLALAAGSYMNANYVAEPGILGHLYESNVGIKLSGNHDLWLDIGVFPSHIGFESAVGTDNWTLTRSLVAENTPYFESGAKLGYRTDNDKWFFSALILNGWQRIKPLEENTLPAFGTQITYTPSPAITLNSSSFFGSDKPDHARQMRYFHNFYGIFKLNDTLAATIGFDIGIEQRNQHSSNMNIWFNPTVLLRYTPSPKTAVAARAEYYDDRHSVIVASNTPHGFKTWGFSANFDYIIVNNITWRIEARVLKSKDNIFTSRDGSTTIADTFLTTSLALHF